MGELRQGWSYEDGVLVNNRHKQRSDHMKEQKTKSFSGEARREENIIRETTAPSKERVDELFWKRRLCTPKSKQGYDYYYLSVRIA